MESRTLAESAEPPASGAVSPGVPLLTFALLGAFALVFVLEHLFAVDQGPELEVSHGPWGLSVDTLTSLGGVSRPLLERGEWWRLFSAPLLHADLFQLLFNGVALLMVGLFLEQLVGRAWLAGFLLIGAAGGSACSVLWHGDVLSVGAAGALMALLAEALFVAQRLPAGSPRTRVQLQLALVLTALLLPVATAAFEGRFDLAVHVGGAVSGALLGAVLSGISRRRPTAMPLSRIGSGLAVAATLLFGNAAIETAVHYRRWAEALSFGGSADREALSRAIDSGSDIALETADAFVAHFPADPHGHLVHAMLLSRFHREDEAVTELRGVLARTDSLAFAEPGLELQARAVLAAMLVDLEQLDEAERVAAPVCASRAHAAELVRNLKLCP